MLYRLLELLCIIAVVNVFYQEKPPVIPVKIIEKQETKKEAPVTTVVLLDNGKKENAVKVSTQKGSRDLNNIGGYVDMTDKKKAPPAPKIMPPQEIKKRFAKALAASPKKAISYILYFKPKKMELTNESKEILHVAINMMKERKPCMVDVIGHTDTTGTKKNNIKVSRIRAKYIKEIIDKIGVDVVSLTIKGFGEEDLLIPTADNVSEPKNRNVEIYIK